jgi:hypothetical protein
MCRHKEFFLLGYIKAKGIDFILSDCADFQLSGNETEQELITIANDYISEIQTEQNMFKSDKQKRFDAYEEEDSYNRELYG